MTPIRIYKLDATGKEVLYYDGHVLERGDTWVYIEATFQPRTVDLGYVLFKQGDVFYETFYSDRWYNVFKITDRDTGALKGWYCNITRPAIIRNDSVRSEDLALDVFVMPQGDVLVLDEDEFEELNLGDYERREVWAAVAEIRGKVVAQVAPFEGVGRPPHMVHKG